MLYCHNSFLFQCFFSLLVLISVGPLALARLYPGLSFPVIGKFLHLLASREDFYFPLVGGPLYLTVGPWFVGEILSGSTGILSDTNTNGNQNFQKSSFHFN